jgi:dTDP-4-amino-4,6-dideoxygalactose transaminase
MERCRIEVGIASYCLAALPVYAPYSGSPVDYPGAMRVHEHGVAFPLYPGMTVDEVAEVCGAASDILAGGGEAG